MKILKYTPTWNQVGSGQPLLVVVVPIEFWQSLSHLNENSIDFVRGEITVRVFREEQVKEFAEIAWKQLTEYSAEVLDKSTPQAVGQKMGRRL